MLFRFPKIFIILREIYFGMIEIENGVLKIYSNKLLLNIFYYIFLVRSRLISKNDIQHFRKKKIEFTAGGTRTCEDNQQCSAAVRAAYSVSSHFKIILR